mmetsp:Transcript_13672/g.49740  ORF Transcript_13672/g.49740 Transcript_13672/m.49740 type:complete len:276 (+) Transcript_13672:122-949(+)|eukprot:scaffold217_cov377-Prasinococcus_capsulatus_cf.AAC.5
MERLGGSPCMRLSIRRPCLLRTRSEVPCARVSSGGAPRVDSWPTNELRQQGSHRSPGSGGMTTPAPMPRLPICPSNMSSNGASNKPTPRERRRPGHPARLGARRSQFASRRRHLQRQVLNERRNSGHQPVNHNSSSGGGKDDDGTGVASTALPGEMPLPCSPSPVGPGAKGNGALTAEEEPEEGEYEFNFSQYLVTLQKPLGARAVGWLRRWQRSMLLWLIRARGLSLRSLLRHRVRALTRGRGVRARAAARGPRSTLRTGPTGGYPAQDLRRLR